MPELESIERDEYLTIISDDIYEKIPESEADIISGALYYIIKPEEEKFLKIFEEYRDAQPNVTDELRLKLDKLVLDELLMEKSISKQSKDIVLEHLSKPSVYQQAQQAQQAHNKLLEAGRQLDEEFESMFKEDDLILKEFDKISLEIEQKNIEHKKRTKENTIKLIGILCVASLVISLIAMIAWNGFVDWFNNNADSYRAKDEKVIPGLGITSKEYQKKYDCVLWGC